MKKKTRELRGAAEDMLHVALRALPRLPHLTYMNPQSRKVSTLRGQFEDAIEGLADALDIRLVKIREDGCMWNPKERRRAQAGDEHNTKNKAAVLVGKQRTQLCQSCASSKAFARYRLREVIA